MITQNECIKILTKNGIHYNEKDCEKILDFLKNLADIALKEYHRKNGKSDNIHESFD
jgi:hypothetical protein